MLVRFVRQNREEGLFLAAQKQINSVLGKPSVIQGCSIIVRGELGGDAMDVEVTCSQMALL